MNIKKLFLFSFVSVVLIFGSVVVAGCTSGSVDTPSVPATPSPTATATDVSKLSVTCPITFHPVLGYTIVNITKEDFLKKGFVLGDSLDLSFSSGNTFRDVPFVSGIYLKDGTLIVGNLEGSTRLLILRVNGNSLSESGVKDGDTVTITLNTSGKYLDLQKHNHLVYSTNRSDSQYTSDEQFANFRALAGGNLKKDFIYRGTIPIENSLKRAPVVDSLMKKVGIVTVLDLADESTTVENIPESEMYDSAYFESLATSGHVIPLGLSLNYRSDAFVQKLADGLVKLTSMDGPVYINGLEGKERTGFVCMLIEALAGASYADLESDFMKSYENYFGLTKSSDSALYDYIKDVKFDDKIRFIANLNDGTDVSSTDIKSAAISFLKKGGMTDAQIEAFIKKITN